MKNELTRRDVLRMSSAAVVGSAMASAAMLSVGAVTAQAAESDSGTSVVRIQKCLKFVMVEEPGLSLLEKFRLLKEIGFDGVELDAPSNMDRDEVLRARDEAGLLIPGVMCAVHWQKTLGDPDPDVRAAGVAGLTAAIADAKAYGASTVLLVPAVVNKRISYDQAYHHSQAEIRKALPVAEEHGIKIAIENVWNGFLLSPLEMARYIDEFESPWIGAYFDVGNIVNFGWPEQWIRILGKRILKIDVKEYSRTKRDKEGPYAGLDVKLGDGDNDWPAVTQALADIGYSGWGSAEVPGGNRERLKEISDRMDRILPTKG